MLRKSLVFGWMLTASMLAISPVQAQEPARGQQFEDRPVASMWDNFKHNIVGDPVAPNSNGAKPPAKPDPLGADRKIRTSPPSTSSSSAAASDNDSSNSGFRPFGGKLFGDWHGDNQANSNNNSGNNQPNANQAGGQPTPRKPTNNNSGAAASTMYDSAGNVVDQNGNRLSNRRTAVKPQNPAPAFDGSVSTTPARRVVPMDDSMATASDGDDTLTAQQRAQQKLAAARRAAQGQTVTAIAPGGVPVVTGAPTRPDYKAETRRPDLSPSGKAVAAESKPVRKLDVAVDKSDADEVRTVQTEMKSSRRTASSVASKSGSLDGGSANSRTSSKAPVLSVDTTGPRTIVVGKEAAYVVVLKNDGEVPGQDILVNIKIPEWTEVVGSQATSGITRPGAAAAGESFQWRISKLDSHSREQLSLKLIPRKSKPFDLAVNWTFSQAARESLVEVQEPKLQMSLAGPDEVLFGQSKVFKLTLSNPGSGDAENVSLNLPPIGGGQDGPLNHQLGTLKAGETKSIEVELTARQAGALVLKAYATAEGGLKAEATEEILVRRAGLQVDVEAPASKFSGTAASYNIKISNPGNAPAENIQIVATLPKQAKFVEAAGGGRFQAEQGKVVWSLPTLRAGASIQVEMKCLLVAAGQNRLQVAATANEDMTELAAANTQVETLADLKLDVVDPAGPITVGDEITYEVHVRNRGTRSAEDIDIVSFFSKGVEPMTVVGAPHEITEGCVEFKRVKAIAANSELVLKIKARTSTAGSHVFRTEVECHSSDTKLAAEQTTHCYSDEGIAQKPSRNRMSEVKPNEPQVVESRAPEADAGEVQVVEKMPKASSQPIVSRGPNKLTPAPLGNDLEPRAAARDSGLTPRR